MATLPVNQISPAGLTDAVQAAAGGGDVFPNTGREWVEVINGGGAPITVTITPQATLNGLTISPLAVVVANGARRKIGPFDPGIFNNSSGNVALAYSAVTSVTVGAYRHP